MLGGIFYALGLILVIALSSKLIRFNKIDNVFEWYSKYEIVTGTKPKDELFRTRDELSIFQSNTILNLFEFTWLILGLLSSNWVIFLTLIIYSLLTKWIITPFEFNIAGKIIKLQLIVVKLTVIFLLIINHFHLHLDITKALISLIQKAS